MAINKKRNLIIINPRAGRRKGLRDLGEITEIFAKAGYISTVAITQRRYDAIKFATELASEVDLITAIGGDGTFNEVMTGICDSGVRVPIGYIPAGSTNDFAMSLALSDYMPEAAMDIVKGEAVSFDVGSFNRRIFSYVATFGAFTQVSYETSQNAKNMLGHLAYILNGARELPSIKAIHARIEYEDQVIEDDFFFGAVSNATSMGGVLNINPSVVDMSDGKHELLLVRAAKNPLELNEIITDITFQRYNTKMITLVSSDKFKFYMDESVDWSLDGEYQKGASEILIKNLHNAIDLVVNEKVQKSALSYRPIV